LRAAFSEQRSQIGHKGRGTGRRSFVADLFRRAALVTLAVWVALALPIACQHGAMSLLDPLEHEHQASHTGHHVHPTSESASSVAHPLYPSSTDSKGASDQNMRHLLGSVELGTPMALTGTTGLAPLDSMIEPPRMERHHPDYSVSPLSGIDIPSSDPPPRA
jgi:hypothetical protein